MKIRPLFAALAIVTTVAVFFIAIVLVCRPKPMIAATVLPSANAPAVVPSVPYTATPLRKPLPDLHRFVRIEKEDKPDQSRLFFSPNSFEQSVRWLHSLSKKELPSILEGTEVEWVMTVKESTSWGTSFQPYQGVGVATRNSGLHHRINPYTTTFRSYYESTGKVRLRGQVVAVTGPIGLSPGYFYVVDAWSIQPLEEKDVHAQSPTP